jgi:FtsZ-interacting cell division protein ZipA
MHEESIIIIGSICIVTALLGGLYLVREPKGKVKKRKK